MNVVDLMTRNYAAMLKAMPKETVKSFGMRYLNSGLRKKRNIMRKRGMLNK